MQESRRALSLIEVCISTVIIAIIIAATLGIFSGGYRYLRKSRTRVAAYSLAREVMEEYSDWATLPAIGTYTNPPDPVILNNVTYTPTLVIGDGPCPPAMPGCPPNNLLKRLNITISWFEDGVAKNFTVTTLKANY